MFVSEITDERNVDCYHFVVLKAVESHIQLIVHFGQVSHTAAYCKTCFLYTLLDIVGLHLFILHEDYFFTSYISSFLLKM